MQKLRNYYFLFSFSEEGGGGATDIPLIGFFPAFTHALTLIKPPALRVGDLETEFVRLCFFCSCVPHKY